VEDSEETTALQAVQITMVQALSDGDKGKQEYCVEIFDKMENEGDNPIKTVFSHKATFHLSGKVYRHTVRIWGKENPH
jgi:hypothetical protein